MCPDIDDLVVSVVTGDETHRVVVEHLLDLRVTFGHVLGLLLRDDDVTEVEAQTAAECHAVTEVLDVVEELCRTGYTASLDDVADDAAERLLRDNLVYISDLLGNVLVEEHAAHRGIFFQYFHTLAVDYILYKDSHRRVESDTTLVVCDLSLLGTVENGSLTLVALAELGDVVKTEYHVLRRHGDRCAVCRVEDVVRTEHEHLGLKNGLVAEGQVHGHLVTVEVGVEGCTCERVELDCLTLDHAGLECLDTETVKRRGTVEQHRMSLHDMLKDIPYHSLLAVNNLLGALDGLHDTALNELTDDERLIELGCHELGDTALVHLQLRTYDDNRTRGIVHTLTEKVLTETTLLTLERVRQRLERTVHVALHCR